MRLILFSLLLVTLCLSEQLCSPYDSESSEYSIAEDVLSTTADGRIVVPVLDQELYKNNHKALGVVTSLNGGTIRLFFAHQSSAKRLYWSVEPSSTTGFTTVRLCVESSSRSCYSPAEVEVDSTLPLTIQVKAHRDSPYVRFSITLSDDVTAQVCQTMDSEPTLVTLSQVHRLSEFPDSGEWQLELQEGPYSNGVDLSQVAVLGLDDEMIIVSLWDPECMSYQHLFDLYEAITGSAPNAETFRPQLLSVFEPSYLGAEPTDQDKICTMDLNSCSQYKFACPKGSDTPHGEGAIPGFCTEGVRGNFVVSGLASSTTDDTAYIGLLIKEDHTSRDLDFVTGWASSAKAGMRFRINNVRDEQPNDTTVSVPLYIAISRIGQQVQVTYLPGATPPTQDSEWLAFDPVVLSSDADELDICVIFTASARSYAVEGVFEDVTLTLLPDQDE